MLLVKSSPPISVLKACNLLFVSVSSLLAPIYMFTPAEFGADWGAEFGADWGAEFEADWGAEFGADWEKLKFIKKNANYTKFIQSLKNR